VSARDDPLGGGQPVPAHRRAVSAAPKRRDRALPAVNERDVAVPEPDQVVDRLGHAEIVGGPHHVDVRARLLTDDHDRELPAQCAELRDRCDRAQQDESLAAEVQQRVDRAPLVPARGHGAEHQVVAAALAGLVQVLDQLGVEGTADVEHDAEQPGTPAGEQAGGPVRPVAEPVRGLPDPAPGLLAGPGPVAQRQ
jgi:hypothetical protein